MKNYSNAKLACEFVGKSQKMCEKMREEKKPETFAKSKNRLKLC